MIISSGAHRFVTNFRSKEPISNTINCLKDKSLQSVKMKEIMTSGRKFIVKLDDEDYEKILVPLIYTRHDTNRIYHPPYVLPEVMGKRKSTYHVFCMS